jgi:polyphosphate kinase 2
MAKDPNFAKPFDGAVSRYIDTEAPPKIRAIIESADKNDILDPNYPYRERLDRKTYEKAYEACQFELVKAQTWYRRTGQRIVVVFEGRDAAGKGGTIAAFVENLNPRFARHVALPAPTGAEGGQWYFQRYISHLPTSGEMVLYDRSWYNRGVVEHVFGWCTPDERARFFDQLPAFEHMLVEEGILFSKVWLAISRPEQLRQFLQREGDPLKHWKLSQTDIDGMARWDDYTTAIRETFERSHTREAPWTVILADDKRRARLAAMQAVLAKLDYPDKAVAAPDPAICGDPGLLRR